MKQKKAGFALVDVLMAVVLLALGISFITSLLTSSHRNVKQAETLTQAAYVAETAKDTLWALTFHESGTMVGEDKIGDTKYQWQAEKTGGDSRINQVKIQVKWTDVAGVHQQVFMTALPVR